MAGEGNGNGGEGKGAGTEVQQQLNDALTKLGGLETEITGLKEAKGNLERQNDEAQKELLGDDYLNYKDGKAKAAAGKGGGGGDADASDGFDYDGADNRQLAAHIGKMSAGAVEKVVKGMGDRIAKVQEGMGLALANVDIALTKMRHDGSDGKPGFEDNRDAIFKVAKENPTWSAEKCYQQYTLEANKTAKEAADAEKEKVEKENKARTEKGEGVPGSTTTGKDITKEDAANLAYDKAFGTKK